MRSLGALARRIDSRFELTAGLSLLLPGSGRLARGDVSVGLFFVSSFGFLAALCWAVLTNLVIAMTQPKNGLLIAALQ